MIKVEIEIEELNSNEKFNSVSIQTKAKGIDATSNEMKEYKKISKFLSKKNDEDENVISLNGNKDTFEDDLKKLKEFIKKL